MQLEEAAFPCPCLRPGLENEQAIGGVAEALLSGHVAEGAEVFLVRVESVRAGVTDDTYTAVYDTERYIPNKDKEYGPFS